MTDKDSLGDRMKDHERITKTTLPRRTYTIIRADGRAFHTYLRNAEKPFDFGFMDDMAHIAKALCEEVSGTVFAYTQSDEISLLVTDFATTNTQPWFGGEVQKIVSTVAATATAALCERRPGRPATFDARVFTVADWREVGNYFIWRQRDAVRNSISMAAQAQFSHKRLHGVNTGQMQELLWSEKGINWNDYPVGAKRGRVVVKDGGEREVTFTHKRTEEVQTVTAYRTWWEPQDAPHFNLNPGGFLDQAIPRIPDLTGLRPVDAQIQVTARPVRRRSVTRKLLDEVAGVYRQAMEDGKPPTQSVAEHFQSTHASAARWVREARKASVLGRSVGPTAGEAPIASEGEQHDQGTA